MQEKKKKKHLYHIKTTKYEDLSVVAASIKEMEKTQITDMTQRKWEKPGYIRWTIASIYPFSE